jgi:hypothetical protein
VVKANTRCPWAASEEMWRYHDLEWGVPVHDDRTHFEFMILEGAQAGLSWSTILKRRDGYRRVLAEFDAEEVARFTASLRRLGMPVKVRYSSGKKHGGGCGQLAAGSLVQRPLEGHLGAPVGSSRTCRDPDRILPS